MIALSFCVELYLSVPNGYPTLFHEREFILASKFSIKVKIGGTEVDGKEREIGWVGGWVWVLCDLS